MTAEKRLLIYMHIPKTGGTTLKNIIKKQYHSKEVWFHMEKDMIPKLKEKRKIDQLKCVGGHCWYGLHEYFKRPYQYFTILRNPIDRIVSEYYYILRRPHHKAYPQVQNMSLMEFIHHFPLKSSNQQTRRISGCIHEPDLDLAKKNLQNNFTVAGLSEMFDESIFLMKKTFNWGDISYSKENVTNNRPSVTDMPKDILSELEKRNEMDLELYTFTKELLAVKLESLDSDSKQELEMFKAGKQD
ncbi:sulfotransferase family 2 domain-containing protein [Bacillus songklensis]|uniref:Sulfotransferase family 2 domain-containing protein n=1 Tax=Bacillus songklensis TaxID=1069116 RepID=A0ABV8B3A9_9BACI